MDVLSLFKSFLTSWNARYPPGSYSTKQGSFNSLVPELAYILTSKRSNVGDFRYFHLYVHCAAHSTESTECPLPASYHTKCTRTWSQRSLCGFGGRVAHTLTITTECAAFFFRLKRWVDKQAGRAGWVSCWGSMRTTEMSGLQGCQVSSRAYCSTSSFYKWENWVSKSESDLQRLNNQLAQD